jgi:hypothetical protein
MIKITSCRVGASLAVLLLLHAGCQTPPVQPLTVAFIGNSYTYANSLPTIVQEIAQSAGFPRPVVGMSAPGGCTLMRHLVTAKTLELLDRGAPSGARWDVVVVQEQSQVPAWAAEDEAMRDLCLGGAEGLVRQIWLKNPKARIIFYETWARAPELWARKSDQVRKAGRDPQEMQQRIRAMYEKMAAKAVQAYPGRAGDVVIARVGDMWERNFKSPNSVVLHSGDGSHPAFAGSYLAGLVLFSAIYDEKPLKVSYKGSFPQADAAALRQLVGRKGNVE